MTVRNEIASVLRQLRKKRKEAVTIQYPEAAKDVKVRRPIFRGMLSRISYVRGVKCSNYQDYAQLVVRDELYVDTLYQFLSEHINKDRIVEIAYGEDCDGYPETMIHINEDVEETDEEYLVRMSRLLDKVKRHTMTREDEIIALEKKLNALREGV